MPCGYSALILLPVGKEVVLDASLESISFQNYSALIVYPDEPCPTQSTSPSNSPTPLPSPSSAPSVSNCPYVPYVPVNASAQEEANSETHVVIEPEEKPPRPPMTEPAEITVNHFCCVCFAFSG